MQTANDGNIKNDRVSVIVPAFNVEKYIGECLKSIASQTYEQLEIIVVNDGSTDKTRSIIASYAEKDNRFLVIDQENQGLVAARKRGLEKAVGRCCLFVDGDDWIDKDLVKFMFEKFMSGDYDAVHANYSEEYSGKSFLQNNIRGEEVLELSDDNKKIQILKKRLLSNDANSYITPSIWSRIYGTEYARRLYSFLPDEQSYGEDILFLLHLILSGNRILLTEKAYYHYRVVEKSLSHDYGINNLVNITKLFLRMQDVLEQYGVYEYLRDDVRGFYWEKLLQGLKKIETPPLRISTYMFPDIELILGKKVVLYGAGAVGKDYYSQIAEYESIKIISWVDKQFDRILNDHMIKNPDSLLGNSEYDFIVIAVNESCVADEIERELVSRGIPKNKLLWEKPLSAYDLLRK